MRNQDKEIIELAFANQALSNQLINARLSTGQPDHTLEIRKLLDQVKILRGSVEQARLQVVGSRRMACERFCELGDKLAEHNHTTPCGQWVMGKSNDALAITDALLRYARQHDGDFPTSLDQATSYLPQLNSPENVNGPISGTNAFDIVYTGSLRDLDNVLPGTVALIRERQPWQTKEGKWARIYGYADGSASRVESDDAFRSWDAQCLIPPTVSK